jgi:hypothetical protein
MVLLNSNLRKAISEYKNKSLYPLHKALWLWIKNRDIEYTSIKKQDWSKYKTSDTIFIFGSGPSINDISKEQWEYINTHDSFGINYFFLKRVPTTFYYCGYEPTSNHTLELSFANDEKLRSLYQKSIWFLPSKVIYRLYHPRIIPSFFPQNTKLAIFDVPPSIQFDNDRHFLAEDFKRSILYRSTISTAIYLADCIGYKNIVLMGIDLHTYHHFFDDYEVFCEIRKKYYYDQHKLGKENTFEDLLPKKESKKRTLEEYYYAVNELYFQPKGTNIYVGNKNNMLSPRIPLFSEFE